MSHTGIELVGGQTVTGAASEASLVFRDGEGNIVGVVSVDNATELHDLTLAGGDSLWIADPGFKVHGGQRDVDVRVGKHGGQVFQVSLDGRRRRTLEQPEIDAYAEAAWQPTAVEIAGDIWVADGYGASLVHRFAADGCYVLTLSGEEGAGRFAEPHDILVRGDELLVADRLNSRVQVYDLEGRFRRVIGGGFLLGPTQMASRGDEIVITDLLAGRVTIVNANGELVEHLFAHPMPPTSWDAVPAEWPLKRAVDGTLIAADLEPGVFHAPHGVAVDAEGAIYVSEFAIGARIAVLRPRDRRS